jgi:hypothetical protein
MRVGPKAAVMLPRSQFPKCGYRDLGPEERAWQGHLTNLDASQPRFQDVSELRVAQGFTAQ